MLTFLVLLFPPEPITSEAAARFENRDQMNSEMGSVFSIEWVVVAAS